MGKSANIANVRHKRRTIREFLQSQELYKLDEMEQYLPKLTYKRNLEIFNTLLKKLNT